MNRLAIFDLDGVLADLKEAHYETFNQALVYHGLSPISRQDHLSRFDGMPTSAKLRMLDITDKSLVRSIQDFKQSATVRHLEEWVSPDSRLAEILHRVYARGYLIGVCSNARKETVSRCLELLSVYAQVSWQYTPDSTGMRAKPSPEMLLAMMRAADSCPTHTVVFEDSPKGLQSAHDSGAKVVQVEWPLSGEYVDTVLDEMSDIPKYRYKWNRINILIPAAGDGQRFRDAGYERPKPFIELSPGKTMLESVVDNLGTDGAWMNYVLRVDHLKVWSQRPLRGNVVTLGSKTDGTAVTCLHAGVAINNNVPLLIANSDQLLEWDAAAFWYFVENTDLDGVVVTFDCPERDPKWSFCEVGDDGLVSRVAEKNPISSVANCGLWFWKRGSDFVKYATRMVELDLRVNGEFYVGPVYNLAIVDGKRIGTFKVDKMHGLGTPADLEKYLSLKKDVR